MSEIILRRHALRHLPELRIEQDVLTTRFDSACSMSQCVGRCCATGVWVDTAERDSILRHAPAIQAHMDPSQERNAERWFDPELRLDSDFPSGRAIATAVSDGGCVFLDVDKRCVLQKASTAETGSLKPFFCAAFPVTISEGTLCLDEPRDAACCTPSPNGSQDVFTLCRHELEFVLGPEGVEELRELTGRAAE